MLRAKNNKMLIIIIIIIISLVSLSVMNETTSAIAVGSPMTAASATFLLAANCRIRKGVRISPSPASEWLQ